MTSCERISMSDPHPSFLLVSGSPGAGLVHVARELTGYEEFGPPPRREPANGEIHLIVGIGDPLRIGGPANPVELRSFVAGLSTTWADTDMPGPAVWSAGIQVPLDPVGARTLLGVSLDEVRDRCVGLEDLFGAEGRSLEERVGNEPDWSGRFARVREFLTRRLAAGGRGPSPGLRWAAERLRATRGRIAVGDLTRELNWSRKRAAREFRDGIGLTPKRWARVLRAEHAIERLRAGERAVDVAFTCGYSDQPHLIRELRTLAGASVAELRGCAFAPETNLQDGSAGGQ
jgi:AraC-like DNA-binding protein